MSTTLTNPPKVGKFRAALLRWMGVSVDLQTGEFWQQPVSQISAGVRIDEKSVLSLSAAFACARLISDAVGSLPLKLYERTDKGRQPASQHPMSFVLTQSPNSICTPVQFWSSIVSSMLLWGNGFAEIKKIGGRIVGLDFIHPSRLRPTVSKSGEITSYKLTVSAGVTRTILPSDVFHVAAFGVDGRWGLSAISYGASVFGSALASSTAANSTFENGLSQTVALKIDRVVTPDQRDAFRTSMMAVAGAINAGKTAVLEAGMDAVTIGINPKDAQLLESRGFSVEEVCRWFAVDPSMIGHGSSVSNWGTGLEQKMIGFLTFTLRPLLTRIEQAIDKQLLQADADRYYAEYSIEGLLRADSAGRAAFYSQMVNLGVMTRDEVRVKENLQTMGGNSAKQTIQSGFTTIDSIGVDDA